MFSYIFVATSCQKDSNANANQQYASILNVASDGQTDFMDNLCRGIRNIYTLVDFYLY